MQPLIVILHHNLHTLIFIQELVLGLPLHLFFDAHMFASSITFMLLEW